MTKVKFDKDKANGGTVYVDGVKVGTYGYLAFGWEFLSTDGRKRGWRHLQRRSKVGST